MAPLITRVNVKILVRNREMQNNDLRKSNQRAKANLNEYDNPVGHVPLLNWGFWQRATTSPEPNKYPKTGGLNIEHLDAHYYPDNAEVCDDVICKVCNGRDILAIEAHYVRELDMKNGAEYMTKHGYPCCRKKYAHYLEQARAKIEGVYLALWHDCDRIFEELEKQQDN